MNAQPVVSISKARRILGNLADNLTDDQIKEILHTLRLLAREHLMYNGSKEEFILNDNEPSSEQR